MTSTQPVKSGILHNSFIRAIMLSAVFLQVGIWVRNFAILLFVMEKTGNNPYAVSLISVAEFAPIFLFSFIGGTFADRWRPKGTMVSCDLLSALSIFIVLLAVIFGSWQAVFFVTFISSILSQFWQPSAMKLFKSSCSCRTVANGDGHVPDGNGNLYDYRAYAGNNYISEVGH